MANEITLSTSLSIFKADSNGVVLLRKNYSTSFQNDMSGNQGPYPGSLTVPTTGKLVYLTAEIVTAGWCWFANQGRADGAAHTDEYIEIGVFDPQVTPAPGVFHPLLELSPGEGFPVKLSRNLQEQYAGSGSGTTTPENYLYLKAYRASQIVNVEAFSK